MTDQDLPTGRELRKRRPQRQMDDDSNIHHGDEKDDDDRHSSASGLTVKSSAETASLISSFIDMLAEERRLEKQRREEERALRAEEEKRRKVEEEEKEQKRKEDEERRKKELEEAEKCKKEEDERQNRYEKFERDRQEALKQLEEKRLNQKKELWEKQLKLESERRVSDSRKKLVDRMHKWEDGDQPEAFLQRFEESMKEAGIEVAEWPARLRPLLSGKALMAYSRDVPEEAKKDYEHLKEAILDAMGLSVKECRADYFTYYKKPCESWQEAARNVEFYVNRMIYGCDTKQDIVSMFALHKVLSLCPPDCLTFVQLQKPGSAIEAASHIQEFFKRQNKGRSHRPWMRNGEKKNRGHKEDSKKETGAAPAGDLNPPNGEQKWSGGGRWKYQLQRQAKY